MVGLQGSRAAVRLRGRGDGAAGVAAPAGWPVAAPAATRGAVPGAPTTGRAPGR